MSEETTFRNVIWAVDAFAEPEVNKQAIESLRSLTRKTPAFIQPVYVLTPDQVNVAPEFYPDWARQYEPLARKALDAITRQSELPGLVEARIITTSASSLRAAVDLLAAHARDAKADVLAVSTHARRGPVRLFMGSFVETLLQATPVPMFVTNPSAKALQKIDRILFASDLGDRSRRAFEKVAGLAAHEGASLTLYYKVITQAPVVFPYAPNLETYLMAELETMRARASAWAEWARKRGVNVDVNIDETSGDVGTAIVNLAESKNYSLTAVVEQTGPVASVLLGSTTRKVVRHSTRPVWVLNGTKY